MSFDRPMRPSLLAALVICVATSPAAAITVAPMSFTELVHASSSVVYARVADVQGRWTDDRRSIESIVTVEVLTPFKGAPGETLTLSVPGGRAGRFINLWPGAPTFASGDLVVLFLTSRGPRLPGPTGLTQGIYRVMADGRSGAMLVMPPLMGDLGPDTRIVRGDPRRRPLSLPDFEAAVRAVQGAGR